MVYEVTLIPTLDQRGFSVRRRIPTPIESDGPRFDAGFPAHLIVECQVIMEPKAIKNMHAVQQRCSQAFPLCLRASVRTKMIDRIRL